jgi:hypothetical protein
MKVVRGHVNLESSKGNKEMGVMDLYIADILLNKDDLHGRLQGAHIQDRGK